MIEDNAIQQPTPTEDIPPVKTSGRRLMQIKRLDRMLIREALETRCEREKNPIVRERIENLIRRFGPPDR